MTAADALLPAMRARGHGIAVRMAVRSSTAMGGGTRARMYACGRAMLQANIHNPKPITKEVHHHVDH